MKKIKTTKLIAILLIVITMLALSGCDGLVLDDNEQNINSSEKSTKINQDFCIGFVANIIVDDRSSVYSSLIEQAVDISLDVGVNSQTNPSTSSSENSESADGFSLSEYYKRPFEYYKDEQGLIYFGSQNFASGKMFGSYITLIKPEETTIEGEKYIAPYYKYLGDNRIFRDNKTSISGTIGENGSLEIEATLFHTYLLNNAVFKPMLVMCNYKDGTLYTDNSPFSSTFSMVESSSSIERKFTTTKTVNGESKKLEYDCKFIINQKQVDYLASAKIVEMSANNTIIKTSVVAEDQENYETDELTEYVIIEKTYKHYNSRCEFEKEYTERQIVNKSDDVRDKNVEIFFPLDNGLVRGYNLFISF